LQVQTNQKIKVQYISPLIVPGDLNFDESYFDSLIQANESVPVNNNIFVIKKILNNLYINHNKYKDKPLIIMMMLYLLFVYMMKHLNDVNKVSFRTHFRRLICDADSQANMLKSLISTNTFQDFTNKIFFKIINVNPAEASNDYENERLNEISQEYKHFDTSFAKRFCRKSFKIKLGSKNNKQF